MKKLVLIILLGGLTLFGFRLSAQSYDGSIALNGSSIERTASLNIEFKEWVLNHISYPDFLYDENLSKYPTKVWFHLNSDGTISVANVKSNNEQLKEHIKKCVNGRFFKGTNTDENFCLAITFKKLN